MDDSPLASPAGSEEESLAKPHLSPSDSCGTGFLAGDFGCLIKPRTQAFTGKPVAPEGQDCEEREVRIFIVPAGSAMPVKVSQGSYLRARRTGFATRPPRVILRLRCFQ